MRTKREISEEQAVEQELTSVEYDLAIAHEELRKLVINCEDGARLDDMRKKQIGAWKKLIQQLNDRAAELILLRGPEDAGLE